MLGMFAHLSQRIVTYRTVSSIHICADAFKVQTMRTVKQYMDFYISHMPFFYSINVGDVRIFIAAIRRGVQNDSEGSNTNLKVEMTY